MLTDHTEALAIVNTVQRQIAQLARTIVNALNDGRVTPWEGISIATQGTQAASTVLAVLQGVSPEVRKDVLYVLEHGHWEVSE